jgi:hypothetical protein
MLFGKRKKSQDPAVQNDPIMRRRFEMEKLEFEREALTVEIEALLKEYSALIGSREPIKGAKPVGTQPNEYSFWHKKKRI